HRPAVMAGAPLHDKVLPLLMADPTHLSRIHEAAKVILSKSDTGCDLEETETPAGSLPTVMLGPVPSIFQPLRM
ncbi:hypothetical protein QO002_004120, partial [Pararhizobium capsulatum DSM 1112]